MLHAFVRADNQDQIGSLAASLETEAATGHEEEHGRAPAVFCAAGGNAFTVVGTEDKARLQRGRHDGDALRSRHDSIGNGTIRSRHDLAQDGAGRLNAVQGCAVPIRGGGTKGHQEYNKRSHCNFSHSSTPINTVLSARVGRLVTSYVRWTRV